MLERRIVGYADALCAAPGDTLQFKISCHDPGPYRADIVRLHAGDDPGGPGFREALVETGVSGEYPGRFQPIRPGSYVRIAAGEPLAARTSFTVHAMVSPTTPRRGRQALVARYDAFARQGWALVVDEDGSAGFLVGERCVSTGVALAPGRWAMVTASLDIASGSVRVTQAPLDVGVGGVASGSGASAEGAVPPDETAGSGALLLAAWEDGAEHERHAGGHFNGKLDAVRLLRGVLGPEALVRLRGCEIPEDLTPSVLGWWDLARGMSTDYVFDCSPSGLHGETVQLPTRGVTGHNWSGAEPCWRHAPQEYGAIHFHDDDLVDAEWETDFTFTVPESMASGVYAARIRQGDPAGAEHVVFFVRPPRGTRTADVAFLVPTASYLAYANYRMRLRPNPLFGSGDPTCPNDGYLKRHPEVGASLYDVHSDWSGVHFSSRHRPLLNLRPRQNRIWGFPADLNILAWLEHTGIGFDVVTDEDLHAEGAALLAPYRAVLTGSHPEYYSTRMLDGVESYLRGGGRLMYLGGNGFYWRIAFHPDRAGVIEVRRAEDGTRAWIAAPGEYYQCLDGEYGGLWRRLGRPPNRTVGIGFAAQGFAASSYYRRGPGAGDPRAAFVFRGVTEEIIGDFGSLGGGAAGEEIDRMDLRLGSPPHALVLASSEAHDEQMLRTKEELLSTMPPFKDPKVRADMVFFECPNGGAVFSTGSITWGASLAHAGYRNNVARVTENVLRRFVDPTPFDYP